MSVIYKIELLTVISLTPIYAFQNFYPDFIYAFFNALPLLPAVLLGLIISENENLDGREYLFSLNDLPRTHREL
ncbi:MAG: hypothetical protein QXJ07_05440 [Candidatus Bathyarchaeia archaeon]